MFGLNLLPNNEHNIKSLRIFFSIYLYAKAYTHSHFNIIPTYIYHAFDAVNIYLTEHIFTLAMTTTTKYWKEVTYTKQKGATKAIAFILPTIDVKK